VKAKQMQRARLPARAFLVAMCNRNTIAVPTAAPLPWASAVQGETARLPQGTRDD